MSNEEIQKQLKEILEKNVWGYVCEDCGGGGRDHENDRSCIKCDGTGVYNWQYDLGVKKIIDLVETIKREVDTYSFSIHPDIAGIMELQGEAIITLDGKVYKVIEENKYSERLETIKREAVEDCMEIVDKNMTSLGWQKYWNDKQEFDVVGCRWVILEKMKLVKGKP